MADAFWQGLAVIIFAALVFVLVRPGSNAPGAVTAVTDTLANIVKEAVGGK